ncbi:TonB-dependent receptor [Desulfobulbus rhabdoformis]|uniref:TonB-dependent receptor plug domain-containing protein n=1 Tax=Desulfobulbus rhabdoformis TaxID=34032 RepID=UPI0019627FFD|nr:TonB-dependent receptor [Desulfobulbus rhabdoformis]MBM9613078.1 TonB-dependent receptor [Desulfobulbus rhabdoformis]
MKKKLLALATMGAMLPALGMAAEKENSSTVLDEIVVTATKTKETRKNIVNSVVVKDSYDIEETPASSLGEVLANEPGLDWRTYGNYGGAAQAIKIRGMSADATLVAVDGVVMNSPSLGTADVGQIPLNSIERIEVVKGPGSLLYGSGAMGGTVNIITKSPQRDHFSAKISAGYGTEDTYHLAAESGAFILGDLGYYLTLNRKETDGFRDNSDLTHNDATLKLLLDKGEAFQAVLDAGLVDREYGTPGAQPPASITPLLPYYNRDSATLLDRVDEQNSHAALTLKGEGSRWFDWKVKGDLTKLDSSSYSRYYLSGLGEQTDVINKVMGAEANIDLHPFSQVNLLLGTEYRNFDYDYTVYGLNSSGALISGPTQDESHRIFTQGTFAELSVQPIEKVKLVGGYRYETHSLFGHEDVTRFGVVITPWENTALKFNRGQHFKAPTMNDLFWPDANNMSGNLNLKPETGWHTDITWEQGGLLNGKLYTSVSYFDWNVDDKIRWVYNSDTFYYRPYNLDSYQASGWEFNIKLGPFYSVQADFSLTLMDAKEQRSGGVKRPALYTPDTQFKVQLIHLSDFGLCSTLVARFTDSRPGYYASDTDKNASIELDSYWTLDLKLEQRIAEHWKVSIEALNLLDEEYDTYMTRFYPTYTMQPYPGAGRSVFASLSYTW